MTFFLFQKIQNTRTKELIGTTQVANVTSRPVVVTDDGHVLLPGQVAAVHADDKTLAKVIEKGLVTGVGYSLADHSSGQTSKRAGSVVPKGRRSSKGSAARPKGE